MVGLSLARKHTFPVNVYVRLSQLIYLHFSSFFHTAVCHHLYGVASYYP